MKAEALIMQGKNGDTPLNIVRQRAGLVSVSGASINDIKYERRAEFAGELFGRYEDLCRWGDASTLIPKALHGRIHSNKTELFLIISGILPAAIFNAVEETILDILTIPRGNLLSLGFFMALIFSTTNGIASMMNVFDASIHVHIRRNWFSQRITSIFLLLTMATALIAGGQSLLNYLVRHGLLH